MLGSSLNPELTIRHLEYLALELNHEDAKFHTDLALCYLNLIYRRVRELFPDEKVVHLTLQNDPKLFDYRRRLREFLDRSVHFDPSAIIGRIPQEFMLEEFIIVLA